MRMAAEFVGKVTEKELEESFQNIKNAYVSQAEEVFEKFGRYVKKNIFLIPPNVVLPEDKGKFDFTKYLMKTQKWLKFRSYWFHEFFFFVLSAHLDPKAKNYNGNSVQIELKQVKNLHQKILNAKYQKAVLKVKLANLQIVAQKQKDFLKQVEQFKTVKDKPWRKNFICQTNFRKYSDQLSTTALVRRNATKNFGK